MDWLSQNWLWVLIGIAFIAMHLFGHSHGSHGGRRQNDGRHARTKGSRLPDGPSGANAPAADDV